LDLAEAELFETAFPFHPPRESLDTRRWGQLADHFGRQHLIRQHLIRQHLIRVRDLAHRHLLKHQQHSRRLFLHPRRLGLPPWLVGFRLAFSALRPDLVHLKLFVPLPRCH